MGGQQPGARRVRRNDGAVGLSRQKTGRHNRARRDQDSDVDLLQPGRPWARQVAQLDGAGRGAD
ncbi:hypothetical protein D3C81_1620990 [compost metagenome]